MASRPSLETLPEELIEIICSHLSIDSQAAIALLKLRPGFGDKYLRDYRFILSARLTSALKSGDLDPDYVPQTRDERRKKETMAFVPDKQLQYRNAMDTLIKLLNLGPMRNPKKFENIKYDMYNPTPPEVRRRLRLRGEPVMLVGEDDSDTRNRLDKLELLTGQHKPENLDYIRHGYDTEDVVPQFFNHEMVCYAYDSDVDDEDYDDDPEAWDIRHDSDRHLLASYWARRLTELIDFNERSYCKNEYTNHDDESWTMACRGFVNDLADAMKVRITLSIPADTIDVLIDQMCYNGEDYYGENTLETMKNNNILGSRVLRPPTETDLYSRSTVFWHMKSTGTEEIIWVHTTKPMTDLLYDDFTKGKNIVTIRRILWRHSSEPDWNMAYRDELGQAIFELLLYELPIKQNSESDPPKAFVLAGGFKDTTLV